MSLRSKSKNRNVLGLASLFGLVALLVVSILCPGLSGAYAAEGNCTVYDAEHNICLDLIKNMFDTTKTTGVDPNNSGATKTCTGVDGFNGASPSGVCVEDAWRVLYQMQPANNAGVSFRTLSEGTNGKTVQMAFKVDSDGNILDQTLQVAFKIDASDYIYAEGSTTLTPEFVILESGEKAIDFEIKFIVDEYLQIAQLGQTKPSEITGELEPVEMVVSPTKAGTTKAQGTEFYVSGNNYRGFSVYVMGGDGTMSSAEHAATNTATIESIDNGTANAGGATIQSIDYTTNSKALADFDMNTWGYQVLPRDYSAIASLSSLDADSLETVKDSLSFFGLANGTRKVGIATAPGALEFALIFGTKIDHTLPADTYSTTVTLSAVAPYDAVAGL